MSTLSVITICFNNLNDLKKTCASLDSQILKPTEHWIINGSTNEEIANWLNNNPQPSFRKWINEIDNGIADAFNKGINVASGQIIHLLNSGDIYESDDVIDKIIYVFKNNTNVQWISAKIQITRGGKKIVIGKPFNKNKLYRGMRSVSHPTWFIKKKVYHKIGLYNPSYKIAMDYDLMCRIANERYYFLNKVVVTFDNKGISSTNYIDSLKENKKIYEYYFGFSFLLFIWQIRLRVLHYLLQTHLGKKLFLIKTKLGFENL